MRRVRACESERLYAVRACVANQSSCAGGADAAPFRALPGEAEFCSPTHRSNRALRAASSSPLVGIGREEDDASTLLSALRCVRFELVVE